MKRLLLAVFILFMSLLLSACNLQDDTDYFEESDATEIQQEVPADGSLLDKFSNKVNEKIENFDPYTTNNGLPKSVYEYDVEESFNITEEEHDNEKSVKEYWDEMWRDNSGGK